MHLVLHPALDFSEVRGAVQGAMRRGPPRSFAREVTNMRGLTLARTRAGPGVESGSRVGRVKHGGSGDGGKLTRPAAARKIFPGANYVRSFH